MSLTPDVGRAAAAGAVASVVSDSMRPYGQRPTRLLYPQDSLGKNTAIFFSRRETESLLNSMTLSTLPASMLQGQYLFKNQLVDICSCGYKCHILLVKLVFTWHFSAYFGELNLFC